MDKRRAPSQMRPSFRQLLALAVLGLAVVGLAACGGKGGGSGSTSTSAPTPPQGASGAAALRPGQGSAATAAQKRLRAAQKRLRAAHRAALRAARTLIAGRLAGSRAARKTKVVLIDLRGDRATATVRLPDGSYTGIPMAKRHGRWQLTEFPQTLFK